jgi:carboxypeptidase family protein/TonB-dependent receptor-like protein
MKRLCFSVLLMAMPLWFVAQSVVTIAQTGVTVSGSAADPTGAVIPGAEISLTNKTTGEIRKTKSDSSGQFTFSGVTPGAYNLKAAVEGFVTAEKPLTVGTKPVTITVKMEISITEEVMIDARELLPELPENNADLVDIGGNLMRGLPMRGDNILPVLDKFLSPAAMGMTGPSIVIDGVEDSKLSIPSNALRSVVINKNPYAAEYRRPGVARIEITTKQGSRQIYDGAFALYLRNSQLNARNAFALEKPDSNLHLFETYFSGPLSFIRRERVSLRKNTRKSVTSAGFFLSGNRLDSDDSVVVNALTPTGPLNQNVPTFKKGTNLLGRVDLVLGRLAKLNFRFNFHDQTERNLGVGGLHLAEQGLTVSERVNKFQMQASSASANNLLNTIRIVFEGTTDREGIRATQPAIKVKGAFTGGPNQTAKSGKETRAELQDIASYATGSQLLRFGGSFRPRRVTIVDASNFGGTFTFSNLTNFTASQPTLFQIVQGNPEVFFSNHEAYAFFQDEIRPTKNLNLMLGVRYEWQPKLKDYNNFAPRLALAFAPGEKKTVFRLGAGVFYDRLPNSVIARDLLLDGRRTRELVIQTPSFPNPFGTGNQTPTLPSVWRIASDLSAPYLIQAGLGVEHRFGIDRQLTVEYQTIRGLHLYRARNINAPLGINGPLPNPNFVLINQIESSASLRSNALIVTARGGLFENFKGIIQYTFSQTKDNTGGTFSLPANNYDLRPEWGRSDLDRRHRFNLAGTLSLPLNMKLGSILSLASGLPFDITTGNDDNRDRVVNDRPFGVTRNSGKGPRLAQLDLRISKSIQLPTPFRKELSPGKSFRNLELNIDAFNVLNRNNLFDIVGERSSPLFGRASASMQARTFQLSVKYSF